jgi:transposase
MIPADEATFIGLWQQGASQQALAQRLGVPIGTVRFGHRAVSPETWTFSDGRPVQLHACQNSMLYHRWAEPFSDTCFYTSRGTW